MEPEQHIDTKESVWKPLTTVTPLSKYLAMILFIILPFVGGWVGYMLALEIREEVIVEKEVVTQREIINDEIEQSVERIRVAEDVNIAMGETVSFTNLSEPDRPRYIVSEAELKEQGFIDESNPAYFNYYAEHVIKINHEYTLLIISLNPAGPTNTFLVHEPSLRVLREIDDSFYPGYGAMAHMRHISSWFVGTDEARTPYEIIALENKEIRINNYLAGISEVVYREEQPDLYFHEVCEILCAGGYVERGLNGSLRISRFRAQPGTTIRSFVDTIEIDLPSQYVPPWLQN